MNEPIRPRRNDDLELELPGGITVRASGKQVALIVIVVISVCSILYALREHDIGTRADIQRIVETQKDLVDSVENVGYIMTLKQEQREALKLDMPPKLRKQLLESERDRR